MPAPKRANTAPPGKGGKKFEMWITLKVGRYRGDVGEMWGRCREMWERYGGDMGEMWVTLKVGLP